MKKEPIVTELSSRAFLLVSFPSAWLKKRHGLSFPNTLDFSTGTIHFVQLGVITGDPKHRHINVCKILAIVKLLGMGFFVIF